MKGNHKGPVAICLELALLTALVQACQGQDQGQGGSNFFYYYSPTQRTQVNMNQNFGHGQVLNPFISQHGSSRSPLFGYQFETTSVQPQYIAPNQYRTPAGTFLTQTPAAHNFQVSYQPQLVTAAPTFRSFNHFGNHQAPLGAQPPATESTHQLQTGAQTRTQQRGTYSFFESPVQFLQQRFLAPALGSLATTPAPVTTPPPAPIDSTQVAESQTSERKPKFSSRFRYVEPEVNPTSRIGGFDSQPYVALPYTERRFYSTAEPSAPTPTGFAYSFGTEDGSKASVHVSMGPNSLSNFQHLTEITGSRLVQRPQTFSSVIPSSRTIPEVTVKNDESPRMVFRKAQQAISTEASSEATISSTSEIPAEPQPPSPSVPSQPVIENNPPAEQQEQPNPQVTPVNTPQSTVETLVKESSVQTETIASPKPELSRKLSDINIPKRLVIRKKVARKRLQLQDEIKDEGADNESATGRRVSPNQLPGEVKAQDDLSKGSPSPVLGSSAESQLDSAPLPPNPNEQGPASELQTVQDTPASSTSQPAVQQVVALPASSTQPTPDEKQEDYYEYYGSDSELEAPAPVPSLPDPDRKTDDQKPLPILRGFREEDFPGVFKHHPEGDNSVETDRGTIVTRYKFSHPPLSVASTESTAQVKPPEGEIPVEPVLVSSTSTTTEYAPVTTTSTTTTTTTTTTEQPFAEVEHHDELSHPDIPSEISSSSPSYFTPETTENYNQGHLQTTTVSTTTELHYQPEEPDSQQIPGNGGESPLQSESERPPSDELHSEKSGEPNLASLSTSTTPDSLLENSQSSTEDSTAIPNDVISSSTQASVDFSPVLLPINEDKANETSSEPTVSTSTTVPESEDVVDATERGDYEDFSYSQEEFPEEGHEGGEIISSDEEIGKAQREALEETLKRLRNRNRQDNNSTDTEAGQDLSNSSNTTSAITSGRRRGRFFVRRPIKVANLTLPTSGPIPNINAVVEDDAGGRSQVIQKIQRFRFSSRTTTTKRPRRVTRPTVTRKVQLEQVQVDSFSESSSVGVDPYPLSTTQKIETTTGRRRLRLESTTEAVAATTEPPPESSPLPPTTTTTTETPLPENLIFTPTTEGISYDTTTIRTTTTRTLTERTTSLPSTKLTTTTITSSENDFHLEPEADQVDEPDLTSEGITTPAAISTGVIYTTTGEPALPSTTPRQLQPPPLTFPAGQLIIHEILPTQPPLKEISFVIGDSIEEDQVIQSGEHGSKELAGGGAAVVRVETKVQVSSSVQKVVKKSENDSSDSERADYSSGSSGATPNGRKVRVIVKKQRKVVPGYNPDLPLAVS